MRALMTGANGDIGYAILNHLLETNYEVVALDKNIERLKTRASRCKQLLVKKIDFCDRKNMAEELALLEQPFDTMIYSAGVREITPAVNLDVSVWQDVMDVNLTGAFMLSQHAIKLAMKHHHPLSIIYISSISGLQGEPERAAYCASKHGLIGLGKSLAIECAKYNVRVNVIAPGIIETELTRPYQSNPDLMAQINNNIPLARWGKPYHIVQTIDLILKNDYLTGSTIVVDGGWTVGKKL